MPTEIEDRLAELRAALPEPDEVVGARMLDVVLVAWAPRRRRGVGRLVAPRTLLAAALVVLVGGSLAFAFGGRVVHAVTGEPPPPKVKQFIASMGHPHDLPRDGAPPWEVALTRGKAGIVKGSAHRVLTIPTHWHGPASLYVARMRSGGYCSVSSWGTALAGGCGTSTFTDAGQPIALSTFAPIGGHMLLTGHVPNPRAAAIRVRYRHGHSTAVPLVSGWFLFEVPYRNRRTGSDPVVAIDVLDGGGARIARDRDPLRLNAPKPHFTMPTPTSVRLLASAALPNKGGTVTIWSGRDAQGNPCFRHLRDGKSQQFPVWQCTPDVDLYGYGTPTATHPRGGQHVPVSWQMGLANDPRHPVGFGYAYAYGWVAPTITRLMLRFQDGSQAVVPLRGSGDFLYVVPRVNWPAGHRPSILTAYDAHGRLVYRQFLYPRQHCIYPGRDPLCAHVALGTG